MGANTPAAGGVAEQPPSSPAFAGTHQPKPLRFDPARLDGLSERLITSHWENNYIGSVKALNMIEGRLAAALADPDLPPVVYGGLKREELHRTGSVVLHEIYFDGLGGNGQATGSIRDSLGAAFGSFDTWETEFRRTAMSLAGGSGWCMLVYNLHTRSLHNHWAWDHMHGAIAGLPLLALDMYEHSYHMDYGTAAARYVDAFFRNIDWEVVDRRYANARAARWL
ncbi:MAG: superoxide dismutase [Sphingomonadaceae bacterium]